MERKQHLLRVLVSLMRSRVRIFHFLLMSSIVLQAQYHDEEKLSIYSKHLEEYRQIDISIPKKYDPSSTEKLNVLYVLDGEWASSLTKTAYEFLAYAEFIPTNILIVSIPNKYKNGNNMRKRDFIPKRIKGEAVSQGVINFQLFLKEELIPAINKKYQTNPQNNILYGSSLGGLFTIYSFLSYPALFRSYLVIEPVLQYADGYINTFAKNQMERVKYTRHSIWIASREGKPLKAMGNLDFKSVLESMDINGLDWKIATYAEETHFSVIWKGLYDGLKFIYKARD